MVLKKIGYKAGTTLVHIFCALRISIGKRNLNRNYSNELLDIKSI